MSVEQIPIAILQIINQLFELERKLKRQDNAGSPQRNLDRIRRSLESIGYYYHDPLGEPYDLTRTDCEASVSGNNTEGLVIAEVIKPIVYYRVDGHSQIVQRGVVIVA